MAPMVSPGYDHRTHTGVITPASGQVAAEAPGRDRPGAGGRGYGWRPVKRPASRQVAGSRPIARTALRMSPGMNGTTPTAITALGASPRPATSQAAPVR